jgi:hypothetical protein
MLPRCASREQIRYEGDEDAEAQELSKSAYPFAIYFVCIERFCAIYSAVFFVASVHFMLREEEA